MKKIGLSILFSLLFILGQAQAPHLHEYTYPVVTEEDANIRSLMNEVSADNLTTTIEHLQSYHTRRYDTRMVYEVQNWLLGQYQQLGFDSVYLHDFQLPSYIHVAETSDNVVAVMKGTKYPEEYVVCGAHYDSYNNSPGDPDSLYAPGADDNASGVSGVLVTARILSKCAFERSLIFVNFAAEEIGLHGSAAYAQDCAEKDMHIVGYFNLDMIGYLEEGSDIHVNLLYTTQDSTIARYVKTFSKVYYPDMPIRQGWLQHGDSDYSSFNRNGYPAIQIFEDTHHSSPFIHTTDDLLGVSVNNMDQAKRFTELNLGVVATLAGLVKTSVEESDSEPLVVYPNPVTETLTIKGVPMRQVEVFNLMGQKVLNETCHEEVIRLDVSSLAAGVYVLRVLDDAMKVHTHRIVTY